MNSNDSAPVGHGPLPARPDLPDLVAAHERGPYDAVEARWQQLVLTWQWHRERHELRAPGRPYPGIVPLLKAARAEPTLRQLYPFTSHHTLCFSSRTTYPWVLLAPAVDPLIDGRFRIRQPRSSTVIGYADSPEEAIALVTAHLPAGLGPAVGPVNSTG
ncbi:DUF6193 family natural product biosynthesis protein [Streptomyces zaomyceticus]|uniref:DUF6193 family natural product biosynthesis protein n=1 Tax=Streptomyces zaomyceticus TaxID=68286 RepID=UPI00370FE9F0